jgi:hypothetical protein
MQGAGRGEAGVVGAAGAGGTVDALAKGVCAFDAAANIKGIMPNSVNLNNRFNGNIGTPVNIFKRRAYASLQRLFATIGYVW